MVGKSCLSDGIIKCYSLSSLVGAVAFGICLIHPKGGGAGPWLHLGAVDVAVVPEVLLSELFAIAPDALGDPCSL